MTQIQIFSERCSGSNFLEELLRANCEDTEISWEFGWKHFFPAKNPEHRDNLLYLALYRNAFDWLSSLHRQPWHAALHLRKMSFSDFIRAEWYCIYDEDAAIGKDDPRYMKEVADELDPATGRRFQNVIKMRASKIEHWQRIQNVTPRFGHILFEDLKKTPEQFLMGLQRDFGVRMKEKFERPQGYKGKPGWRRRLLINASFGLLGNFKEKKYEPIGDADKSFIIEQLDWNIESQIGYRLNDSKKIVSTQASRETAKS